MASAREVVLVLMTLSFSSCQVQIASTAEKGITFVDDPQLYNVDSSSPTDQPELDDVHIFMKHGVPLRGTKQVLIDHVQGFIHPEDVHDDVKRKNEDVPEKAKGRNRAQAQAARQKSRSKRSIVYGPQQYWTNGIVPYLFSTIMTDDLKKSFYFASELISKYTCVRFVPWTTNTRTQYGLNHDNYLLFMGDDPQACNSFIGMAGYSGQQIRCCYPAGCVHELGHALGFEHEHISYLSEGWIRVNRGLVSSARQYPTLRPESGRLFTPYDISSPMEIVIQTSGGIPDKTILFPELSISQNYFYMLGQISSMYNCKERNCSSHMTCYYDGYVTMINGQCKCNCIEGRDPATGCQTFLAQAQNTSPLPGGNYAFPAPKEGCPTGYNLSSGTLEHFFSSTGIYQNKPNLLMGDLSGTRAEHRFCVKQSPENGVSWPRGNYCLLRKGGACPIGFQSGYIQFDNKQRQGSLYVSTWSGSLPDGTYGTDTRWMFCCRSDSVLSVPMELPNTQPLALFQLSYFGCQPIAGMNSVSNMMFFQNDNTSLAKLSASGTRPLAWLYSSQQMFISFCYYYPLATAVPGCGGVITLSASQRSATFTSPRYPSNYDNKLECIWTVEGPEGSSLLLTFSDFDIEGVPNSCEDALEVKHALVGQNGLSYCGQEMYSTVRSIANKMSVKLITGLSGQRRGFNATVKAALAEDHCYNQSDKGATYRGTINFTRDFKPCLPWSQVTHCPHHPFQTKDFYDGLDGNFCRNPGDGLRPWCYTNATLCQQNYCDVCQLETAYDTKDAAFCQQLLTNGSCSDVIMGRQYCARTCANQLPPVPTPVAPYTSIKCQPPSTPPDSALLGTLKADYNLGETVEFACVVDYPAYFTYDDYYDYIDSKDCVSWGYSFASFCDKSESLVVTCLSDGKWSSEGYVCGGCPDGWHPFKGNCYKVMYEEVSYSDAWNSCHGKYRAVLSEARDAATNDFLLNLRDDSVAHWTGLKYQAGKWVWQDNSVAQWTNWATGEPGAYTCAYVDEYGKWADGHCAWDRAYICMKPRGDRTLCADRRSDCASIVSAVPAVCQTHAEFAITVCPLTCGVCTA